MFRIRSDFSRLVWEMLGPEEKVVLILFFEAGDDGLTFEEAKDRFKAVWPMEPEKIEEWRAVARYGSAAVCH